MNATRILVAALILAGTTAGQARAAEYDTVDSLLDAVDATLQGFPDTTRSITTNVPEPQQSNNDSTQNAEEAPSAPSTTETASQGTGPGNWFWVQKRGFGIAECVNRGRSALQSAGMVLTNGAGWWVSAENDVMQSYIACLDAGYGFTWVNLFSGALPGTDMAAYTQQIVNAIDAGVASPAVVKTPSGGRPEMWFWIYARNYSIETCRQRGQAALELEGFTLETGDTWYVSGIRDDTRAIFSCLPWNTSQVWSHLSLTAPAGRDRIQTRDRLVQAFDRGS